MGAAQKISTDILTTPACSLHKEKGETEVLRIQVLKDWFKQILIVCLILSTGCSLINPHVQFDLSKKNEPVTVKSALQYADGAIDKYKSAIGDQSTLTSVTGLTLIPLGAAALAVSIVGLGTNVITALGVGGAAGIGVSSWLSSKPRQLVYAAGIEAMTCAKDAIQPFNLAEDTLNTLFSDVKDLNASIASVETSIADIEAYAATNPQEAELAISVKQSVTRARSLVDEARAAYQSGSTLNIKLARAGHFLISAVDSIGAKVDVELTKTEPNVASIAGAIGGLAEMAHQIERLPGGATTIQGMAGGPPAAPKVGLAIGKPNLSDLLRVLINDANALSQKTRSVSAVVNSIGSADLQPTLKRCSVDVVATISLQVQPPGGLEFDESTPSTKRVIVSGGKPPYFAYFLATNVPGLVPPQNAGTSLIEITKTNQATPTGQYQLYITDTAGNNTTVNITITKKSSGPLLSVEKLGRGNGKVEAEEVAGGATQKIMECTTKCDASIVSGKQLVLKATANSGSIFVGWSGGGCSGIATCNIPSLSADTNVTATFAVARALTVATSGAGTGTVTSAPAGITCPGTCAFNFADGTSVTLTATATAGSVFTGWSGGGCSGAATTCQVPLSAATNVMATFAPGH